jgi:hypothetical protein
MFVTGKIPQWGLKVHLSAIIFENFRLIYWATGSENGVYLIFLFGEVGTFPIIGG